MILKAADEWHTPPWVVEAQCSQAWWDRLMAWRAEVSAFEQKMSRNK